MTRTHEPSGTTCAAVTTRLDPTRNPVPVEYPEQPTASRRTTAGFARTNAFLRVISVGVGEGAGDGAAPDAETVAVVLVAGCVAVVLIGPGDSLAGSVGSA